MNIIAPIFGLNQAIIKHAIRINVGIKCIKNPKLNIGVSKANKVRSNV